MPAMFSYPHRQKSGQITCYLNRTYHVLTTAEGTVVATDSYFSVDSNNRTGGARLHAVIVQMDSVAVSSADIVFSVFPCCAPSFEFNRRGKVCRLCRRSFRFPC